MNRKLDIAMVAAVSLLAGLLLGLWAASRADDGAAEPIDNDAAGLLARAAVDEFVPSEPAGGASRRDESGRSGGGKAAPHTADAAEPSTAPMTINISTNTTRMRSMFSSSLPKQSPGRLGQGQHHRQD